MPYYKNTQNQVYWFDDDAEKQKYSPVLTAITDAEADELRQPPAPTPLELAATRLVTINARLAEIDAARSWPLADLALGINVEFARQKLAGLEEERAGLGAEKMGILSEFPQLAG